jgi:hypothetical protein
METASPAAAVGVGVALSLLLQLNKDAMDLSVVDWSRLARAGSPNGLHPTTCPVTRSPSSTSTAACCMRGRAPCRPGCPTPADPTRQPSFCACEAAPRWAPRSSPWPPVTPNASPGSTAGSISAAWIPTSPNGSATPGGSRTPSASSRPRHLSVNQPRKHATPPRNGSSTSSPNECTPAPVGDLLQDDVDRAGDHERADAQGRHRLDHRGPSTTARTRSPWWPRSPRQWPVARWRCRRRPCCRSGCQQRDGRRRTVRLDGGVPCCGTARPNAPSPAHSSSPPGRSGRPARRSAG